MGAKNQLSVLVVDDVEINVDVLETALEEKYRVYKALSGEEALEILRSHPKIVAMITDVQMPKMGGVKLVKAIRNDLGMKKLIIIANTAFGDLQTDGELRMLGVDGFIYKPNTPEEVEEKVTRALELSDK